MSYAISALNAHGISVQLVSHHGARQKAKCFLLTQGNGVKHISEVSRHFDSGRRRGMWHALMPCSTAAGKRGDVSEVKGAAGQAPAWAPSPGLLEYVHVPGHSPGQVQAHKEHLTLSMRGELILIQDARAANVSEGHPCKHCNTIVWY